MTPSYLRENNCHILYDCDVADHVGSDFFNPAVWEARGALVGTARGRGTAVFVRGLSGEYVLRHYQRGGLPARFVEERYLWTGLERSRPWREWQLLVRLSLQGLPVPRPVAARATRQGLFYTADIVTSRIVGNSLARRLRRGALEPELWGAVGRCIRQFHHAGVDHADLNANNILVDQQGAVHLIDFDQGRLRSPGPWQRANLNRLQRSLRKLATLHLDCSYREEEWDLLLAGYSA